jgi:DnaJ-domain-containing protein 1
MQSNKLARLFRWKRTPVAEGPAEGGAAMPPRPEVLRQPEIDEELRHRMRRPFGGAVIEDEFDDETLKVYSAGRYRVRPSWDDGGPKWDPYDENQSSGARVRSARSSRIRSHGPAGYQAEAAPGDPARLSYYQVLGVRPDATSEQIEKAYRRYAASIHPDKFFGDPKASAQAEKNLRDLNALMQVLRDPAKRAAYDDSW